VGISSLLHAAAKPVAKRDRPPLLLLIRTVFLCSESAAVYAACAAAAVESLIRMPFAGLLHGGVAGLFPLPLLLLLRCGLAPAASNLLLFCQAVASSAQQCKAVCEDISKYSTRIGYEDTITRQLTFS
jgi:hypothetical protein